MKTDLVNKSQQVLKKILSFIPKVQGVFANHVACVLKCYKPESCCMNTCNKEVKIVHTKTNKRIT